MAKFFISYRTGSFTGAGNKFVESIQVVLVWLFLGNKYRRLRFVERILDFVRPVAGVGRNHDRPDAGQCEIDVRPFSIAGHPDRHFIAFTDAQAEKAPGDKIRRLLELAVGDFAVLKD